MTNPPLDEVEWIPGDLADHLRGEGVITLLDLAMYPPEVLVKFGLSGGDALNLVEKAGEEVGRGRRGVKVLGGGRRRRRVSTGSSSLDNLLGGGVSTGRVTEIYGESGVGKTQLCFQLCVNAHPSSGDVGDVVFVDTVGTFRPERVAEMATGRGDEEELLRRILLVKARTAKEQMEVPRNMGRFSSARGVKMLIIDTLTDNFVYEFQGGRNISGRQLALARHLHELAATALDKDVAVVVTNTVRSRMVDEWGGRQMVETGGNTVSQGVHIRVWLERGVEGFTARLDDGGGVSARFKIGKAGIMDSEG